MKVLARLLVVCLVALSLAACLPFAIFEDVGDDPHPPTLTVLGIAVQPPDPPEGEVAEEPVFVPVEGFVVRPNDASANTFILNLQFSDAGGDVTVLKLRDRDGNLNLESAPVSVEVDLDGDGVPETLDAPEFFPGTSVTRGFPGLRFDVTQVGVHRIEVWAEDSHGSRSPKVEFTVIIEI